MNCGQQFAYDAMSSLWCLHYESVVTTEPLKQGGSCQADSPITVPVGEFVKRVDAAIAAVRGGRGAELRSLAAMRMSLKPRMPISPQTEQTN